MKVSFVIVTHNRLERLLQSSEGCGAVGVHHIENPVRKPAASDDELVERCAADR